MLPKSDKQNKVIVFNTLSKPKYILYCIKGEIHEDYDFAYNFSNDERRESHKDMTDMTFPHSAEMKVNNFHEYSTRYTKDIEALFQC